MANHYGDQTQNAGQHKKHQYKKAYKKQFIPGG